jgi:hypothetical protein
MLHARIHMLQCGSHSGRHAPAAHKCADQQVIMAQLSEVWGMLADG